MRVFGAKKNKQKTMNCHFKLALHFITWM